MPRPIGISSTAAIARTSTVKLLTLPRLCGRGRPAVVSGGTRQSWLVNPDAGCAAAAGSSQRNAAAGPGTARAVATAARHAAAVARALRLPHQAPRRGRARGGIILIIYSDEV